MIDLTNPRFEELSVRKRLIGLLVVMTDRDINNPEHLQVANVFLDLLVRHMKEETTPGLHGGRA